MHYIHKFNKFLYMYIIAEGPEIKHVGFALTCNGVWRKMCRKLDIAYDGYEADGK